MGTLKHVQEMFIMIIWVSGKNKCFQWKHFDGSLLPAGIIQLPNRWLSAAVVLTQDWTDYRNCPFMSFRPRNWVSGSQVEEATLSDGVSKNTFLLQSLVKRKKKNILCSLFIHILSQENDFKQCTVLWRVTVYFKAQSIDMKQENVKLWLYYRRLFPEVTGLFWWQKLRQDGDMQYVGLRFPFRRRLAWADLFRPWQDRIYAEPLFLFSYLKRSRFSNYRPTVATIVA